MPIQARVKKLETDDGLAGFKDHVKVGDVYTVYPETIQEFTMLNTVFNKRHTRLWVQAQETPTGGYGLIPLELLELEST